MGAAHSGRHDVVRRFLEQRAEAGAVPDDCVFVGGVARLMAKHPLFARYGDNFIVSHTGNGGKGAPAIFEEHPSLAKLFSRIDHRSMTGTLVTNFTMTKPGALHRANGGRLVLDALRVLSEPLSRDALSRSLSHDVRRSGPAHRRTGGVGEICRHVGRDATLVLVRNGG